MAAVLLSDVYEPVTFNQAVQEAAIEVNAFVSSGVLLSDPRIDEMASIGGHIGDLPFYNGLTNDEPDYSSDDPASFSTPAKITDEKQIFRKAMMNKAWSTMDLSRELALSDPLGAITSRIGHYWSTMLSRRLIQSSLGVLADNVAADSSDMLYTIATDAAATATAAEKISAEAVIAAAATMGDAASGLTAIAMHSVVYNTLQTNNLIDFIPDARGEVKFATYLGYVVVVDDAMPAVAGSNRITYTSVLFNGGSYAHGVGTPTVPSELDRVPSSGDGGGQDIIYSRRTDIVHPYGFAFISGSVAGDSATEAELAAAANWNRVYANRKNIGLAFLQTNG